MRLGVLGPHFIVAHGVWLDDDDMARLGDHGASVAHNPGSNMRLGSGLADTRAMLDAPGQSRHRHRRRLVLRQPEHVRGDAACLVRLEGAGAGLAALADRRARRRWRRPRAAPACSALATASGGSRRATRPIWCLLDLDHPNWLPLNDPVNQLVHCEDGTAVDSVMIGGRLVVENRRGPDLDLARLRARADGVARPPSRRQCRQPPSLRRVGAGGRQLLPRPRPHALSRPPLRGAGGVI